MSDTVYTPRVNKLDVPFASDRLDDFRKAKARAEDFANAPQSRSKQWSLADVVSNSKYVAFYEFGLGHPVHKIRQTFAEAATAALGVFRLRGTLECRPDLPGTKDYSFTNSRDCFEAICMALIAGDDALAQKLADLMWDPPKATYLGHDSEVCTINQQCLAYAVKHLIQDHLEEVDKELRRISNRKVEQQIAAIGKIVRGLAQNSDTLFNEGLLELLFFHRRTARKQDGPLWYFSLAGVGLSILAVRRGLLKISELPRSDFLPLELIS